MKRFPYWVLVPAAVLALAGLLYGSVVCGGLSEEEVLALPAADFCADHWVSK